VSPDWPLETERLTLRPFVEGDFDAVHATRSSPEVVLQGDVAFHWVSERDRTAEIGFVFDPRH
jgi:hypothetical protein